jgi:hypothetical protein
MLGCEYSRVMKRWSSSGDGLVPDVGTPALGFARALSSRAGLTIPTASFRAAELLTLNPPSA